MQPLLSTLNTRSWPTIIAQVWITQVQEAHLEQSLTSSFQSEGEFHAFHVRVFSVLVLNVLRINNKFTKL